jgi:hypothetical protein
MAYDINQVRAILRKPGGQGIGFPAGNADGGSIQSQHEAAIQFFELALTLDGEEALMESERAFAEAEIARHRAALAPSEPHPPMGRRSQPKAV